MTIGQCLDQVDCLDFPSRQKVTQQAKYMIRGWRAAGRPSCCRSCCLSSCCPLGVRRSCRSPCSCWQHDECLCPSASVHHDDAWVDRALREHARKLHLGFVAARTQHTVAGVDVQNDDLMGVQVGGERVAVPLDILQRCPLGGVAGWPLCAYDTAGPTI